MAGIEKRDGRFANFIRGERGFDISLARPRLTSKLAIKTPKKHARPIAAID
jgi:hypothetical protein